MSGSMEVMELHVALTGRNGNSGETAADAVPDIQTAYDALARRHGSGTLSGVSRILVHEGEYFLPAPLHFYAAFPVEIMPYGRDRVVISGGRPLAGWTPAVLNGRRMYRCSLPKHVDAVPFLYVDGRAVRPARWPKEGFLRVADDGLKHDHGSYALPGCNDFFPVKKGDFDPEWSDPGNISVRMIHWWTEENLNVAAYDPDAGVVRTANSRIFDAKAENTEFVYDNVREALTEPDEYYFDRRTHELWYLPPAGTRNFTAILPERGVLVRFDDGVRGVTLRGLEFRYGGAYIPRAGADYDLRDPGYEPVANHANRDFFSLIDPACEYQQSAQGAVQLPGMLFFADAADCAVEKCEISRCGWYAAVIAEAGRNLFLRNNHFHHLGGGGIAVSGGNFETCRREPHRHTSHVTISGNHIHDCGSRFPSALGIVMTQVASCLVEGNHIHDLFYSGISCGWTWGFHPTMARENRILNNHIHDLGKGLLSDMGGIYTLGVQPGTRVAGNVVHGIKNRYYGGWGLYADEGSSHIVFEHNLVYDCACDGFHQHYGRENVLRNNIFALNHICAAGVGRDADDGYASPGPNCSKAVVMMNNLFLCEGEDAVKLTFDHLLERDLIFSDNNIFWNPSGRCDLVFLCGERRLTFRQWQSHGLDRHSVFADPGLRDAEHGDFRLKRDSILRQYGFDGGRKPPAGVHSASKTKQGKEKEK
ncbi:MAG: right-handed parallel beta-helix repeat-containing protein [Lentisphaeria bacterium]|nr:right-handed parallel beta-helix repeat-containing protein [Lentisphaeria bacterium]